MATKKTPTKEEILEVLREQGITTLEQFMEALTQDETGGFGSGTSDAEGGTDGTYHASINRTLKGHGPDGHANVALWSLGFEFRQIYGLQD